MTRTLAILVFPDAETLDFAGPYEVFSLASELAAEPAFETRLVARGAGPVVARHGFTVVAGASFVDLPHPDILLVPGGRGTRTLIHDEEAIGWIRGAAARAERVLSVCTGSFLLAKAGLLGGLPCTTHWGSIERMRGDFPGLEVREGVRFVDNGRIITAAGISAGIDMALHVVSGLLGPAQAVRTAREMEYVWQPEAEPRQIP